MTSPPGLSFSSPDASPKPRLAGAAESVVMLLRKKEDDVNKLLAAKMQLELLVAQRDRDIVGLRQALEDGRKKDGRELDAARLSFTLSQQAVATKYAIAAMRIGFLELEADEESGRSGLKFNAFRELDELCSAAHHQASLAIAVGEATKPLRARVTALSFQLRVGKAVEMRNQIKKLSASLNRISDLEQEVVRLQKQNVARIQVWEDWHMGRMSIIADAFHFPVLTWTGQRAENVLSRVEAEEAHQRSIMHATTGATEYFQSSSEQVRIMLNKVAEWNSKFVRQVHHCSQIAESEQMSRICILSEENCSRDDLVRQSSRDGHFVLAPHFVQPSWDRIEDQFAAMDVINTGLHVEVQRRQEIAEQLAERIESLQGQLLKMTSNRPSECLPTSSKQRDVSVGTVENNDPVDRLQSELVARQKECETIREELNSLQAVHRRCNQVHAALTFKVTEQEEHLESVNNRMQTVSRQLSCLHDENQALSNALLTKNEELRREQQDAQRFRRRVDTMESQSQLSWTNMVMWLQDGESVERATAIASEMDSRQFMATALDCINSIRILDDHLATKLNVEILDDISSLRQRCLDLESQCRALECNCQRYQMASVELQEKLKSANLFFQERLESDRTRHEADMLELSVKLQRTEFEASQRTSHMEKSMESNLSSMQETLVLRDRRIYELENWVQDLRTSLETSARTIASLRESLQANDSNFLTREEALRHQLSVAVKQLETTQESLRQTALENSLETIRKKATLDDLSDRIIEMERSLALTRSKNDEERKFLLHQSSEQQITLAARLDEQQETLARFRHASDSQLQDLSAQLESAKAQHSHTLYQYNVACTDLSTSRQRERSLQLQAQSFSVHAFELMKENALLASQLSQYNAERDILTLSNQHLSQELDKVQRAEQTAVNTVSDVSETVLALTRQRDLLQIELQVVHADYAKHVETMRLLSQQLREAEVLNMDFFSRITQLEDHVESLQDLLHAERKTRADLSPSPLILIDAQPQVVSCHNNLFASFTSDLLFANEASGREKIEFLAGAAFRTVSAVGEIVHAFRASFRMEHTQTVIGLRKTHWEDLSRVTSTMVLHQRVLELEQQEVQRRTIVVEQYWKFASDSATSFRDNFLQTWHLQRTHLQETLRTMTVQSKGDALQAARLLSHFVSQALESSDALSCNLVAAHATMIVALKVAWKSKQNEERCIRLRNRANTEIDMLKFRLTAIVELEKNAMDDAIERVNIRSSVLPVASFNLVKLDSLEHQERRLLQTCFLEWVCSLHLLRT